MEVHKPVLPTSTREKTASMFPGFEKLIEARIKKAQENGAFEDLPGSGKPLDLADDRHIPEELRMAHKILKNAGCTPPEVQLRNEIHTTEDLLANMTDTEQKYRTIKKLNYLVLKLNTLRNTNSSFDIPQRYYAEVVDRIESGQE